MNRNLNPQEFNPFSLEVGKEVEVDPNVLAASPHIRRDERDAHFGGDGGSPFYDAVMDDFVPDHGMDLKYKDLDPFEAQRSGEPTTSIDGDTYIDAIANSMRARGQLGAGILRKQEEGGFWLAEGNHRLAAARRAELPFRVKRVS